jgi:WD40 repeat protein
MSDSRSRKQLDTSRLSCHGPRMNNPVFRKGHAGLASALSRRDILEAAGLATLAFAVSPVVCLGQTATKTILWSAVWNPDGKSFAVGGSDGTLRLISADLQLLKKFSLNASVQCLEWHPSGKLLAIALDDRPTHLLTLESEKILPLDDSPGSRALAWSPDGQFIAIGDYDGYLSIRKKDGQLIKRIKSESGKTCLSVDWHPKKDLIVTGSDKIRLCDTSGKLIASIAHRKEDTIVLAVQWHPEGEFFASGDYGYDEIESLLQFWSESGAPLKSMRGSKTEYRNLRWSPKGDFLASVSDALRIWSREGETLHVGESPERLWGVDWQGQGKSIVTSSAAGKIRLWTDQAKMIKETV